MRRSTTKKRSTPEPITLGDRLAREIERAGMSAVNCTGPTGLPQLLVTRRGFSFWLVLHTVNESPYSRDQIKSLGRTLYQVMIAGSTAAVEANFVADKFLSVAQKRALLGLLADKKMTYTQREVAEVLNVA